MKTAIIGGGKGARDVMELAVEGRLKTISLDVVCVADPNPDAPGMVYARSRMIPALSDFEAAVKTPGLELILELTGRDDVIEKIYHLAPPGVRVVDHVLARVFWDVEQAHARLRAELRKSRELEETIDRDRHQLKEILDAVPDMVLVMDRGQRIERVNARFEEMTGLKREAVEGQLCHAAYCKLPEEERCEEGVCPFQELFRTGAPVHLIRHFEAEGGQEESYHEVYCNPVRDEQGRIVRVVKTSRPITDQVKLQRATEESEQRFRQFLDAAHDLIVMKDAGGRYLYVNRQAAEMLGFSPEDFIGKTDYQVLPEKLARLIAKRDAEVMENRDYTSKEEKLAAGGKVHYLDTVRFPLFDYKGDVAGVASISRDVTGHKELERELLQSERLAAVGKLAAGVAHEINNPLTGILTFTESLLLDAPEDDPRREDYEIILRETMRCRQIVRDLLDYSRQEKPKRESSDLNRLVERAVGLVKKQAEFHDIKFVNGFGEGLPPVDVDPNQIQQVLLNLVINAKDAMNKTGTITLRTGTELGRERVWVEVADTGPGIPADKLQRIFEPFYTTKGHEGNGLGLPVVVSIIDQHGGRVEVTSELGKGATFRVTLPAGAEAEEPA